jgi:5-methylcytosine-specific restriction protein A
MPFEDITDPRAVRLAAAEFDRLGAEAFLAKYGFGKARNYFLLLGDREYDSKAILGAAHAYQFPDRGPLRPSDFSGGEATVATKLEALDFTVRRRGVQRNQIDSDHSEESPRNPSWNQDELILALDAYVKWKGLPPAKTSKAISDLSRLMNELRHLLGTPPQATLRNANGVYMKLMNFRRFDPAFTSQGKSGLSRGNRLEEIVWKEFHADPARLGRVAATIRAAINEANGSNISYELSDDVAGDAEAIEGRIMTVMHRRRERSRDLLEKRKKATIRKTGALACEVCSFNFLARYGERGRDFIECHHLRPVELLGDGTPTTLSDLALVCSNCHRMIHARRPWLSLDELKACLRGQETGANLSTSQ